MNCRDVEMLLLAEGDGAMSDPQRATLESHVMQCPDCRELRHTLATVNEMMREEAATVTVPDVETEWRAVRDRLSDPPGQSTRKRPFAPIIWLGGSLAVAAAIAVTFFVAPSPSPQPETAAQLSDTARADFVEAGDANASTLVYVDKDSGWLVVWATDADVKNGG